MRHIAYTLCAAALTVVTLPAAAGDAAAGKAKIGVCMACHGQSGKGTTPDYPNIGGQSEKYLVSALKAYKSGARNNPIMKPMVAALSDVDLENVAAYYASQDPCK
jgi:cytochrome c553